MRHRKQLVGVAAAVAAWFVLGGSAMAAFPNFSDCPTGSVGSGGGCIDVQSNSGEIIIKGFRVPLDHSLEIRGGIRGDGTSTFVPPAGTNGFFAQPVNVPGGLLGIELPIGLNLVTATAELAGTASSIHFEILNLAIEVPIKLRLSNPLLASNCHIGSNAHPVLLRLITTTTSPPLPNRPITGRVGTQRFIPPNVLEFLGGTNVDNSFSIPGATECGGLGLIDLAVDAKLQIPSSSGNNTIVVNNDVGLALLP